MRYADLKCLLTFHPAYWTLIPFPGLEVIERQLPSRKERRAYYYGRLTWLFADLTVGPVFWITEERQREDVVRKLKKEKVL